MGDAVVVRTDRLDPSGFARLYQQHWKVLWCAAAAVVNDRTLAQDIVQQAAVVGLQRLHQFDAGTSFTAWMTQIVRNIALNEGRKRGRRRTSSESALLDAESRRTTPDGTRTWSDPNRSVGEPRVGVVSGRGQIVPGAEPFDDDLTKALENLEETARGCLLMRVVLDMPYKEIALALDIPEGTAASHVHRARASLRQALRQSPPSSANPTPSARRTGGMNA